MLTRLTIERNYITGKPPKKLTEESLKRYMIPAMIGNLSIKNTDGRFSTNCTKLLNKLISDGFGEMARLLASNLDVVTIQNILLHQEWKNKYYNNYVVSSPLLDILSSMDISMPCSQLKEGYCGYFELAAHDYRVPEKFKGIHGVEDRLDYILFKIFETEGRKNLLVSFSIRDEMSFSSFCIRLDDSKDVFDVFRSYVFKSTTLNPDKGGVTREDLQLDEKDMVLLKLAINLITYVTNPNEEFRKEFNKFTGSSKLKNQQKIQYTERPYIRIGYESEFLKLVSTESFDVRGHWRWAHVGPMRMSRRFTFVRPHTRNQKKFKEAENE